MEGKKTPLYDTHVKYGGSIVDFGGFLLPVQYEAGIKKEHMAVRTECGLFDVSHMGEILVQGEKALEFLNHVLTNDYTDLKDGCARYSPMCNENGGPVDDLIVYKKADNDYFVVVNAANKRFCLFRNQKAIPKRIRGFAVRKRHKANRKAVFKRLSGFVRPGNNREYKTNCK